MQGRGLTAKEWCRQKDIKYSQYCGWASRVNREARLNQEQQWADATSLWEDALNDEIRIHCGKFKIFVGPDFNPTLLGAVLKVVQTIC